VQFPDKSQPEVPQKKTITPVIQGAKISDRGSRQRFFGFLLAESPRELGLKIGREVMVPRMKAGLEASLNAFLSGMLWGGGPRPFDGVVSGTVLRANPSGTNYNAISSGTPLQQAQAQVTTQRSTGVYKNVLCGTQQEAEFLLANLTATFNDYNVVCIADLYEMAGIKPSPSDNAYGWLDIDAARIVKTRDGYELEMPRPRVI